LPWVPVIWSFCSDITYFLLRVFRLHVHCMAKGLRFETLDDSFWRSEDEVPRFAVKRQGLSPDLADEEHGSTGFLSDRQPELILGKALL
jgi:hypothetical protein